MPPQYPQLLQHIGIGQRCSPRPRPCHLKVQEFVDVWCQQSHRTKEDTESKTTSVFIWHPTCKVEQNCLIVTPKPINVSICPNITPLTKEQCKSLFFPFFLSVMNKKVYFKHRRRLMNFTTLGKKKKHSTQPPKTRQGYKFKHYE